MKDYIVYEVSGWGEADFPEVRFAFDLAGVKEAVAHLMYCPLDDNGRKEAAELCEGLGEDTELPWTVAFEQGGLHVRKIIAWLPADEEINAEERRAMYARTIGTDLIAAPSTPELRRERAESE
ncbi:hypothetical protein E4T66_18665 [Sinimarinibacterium sp. CAU 1509]|uniref:hypothetical protein n=1 Tax=Sinimarinibacterium sp. CAU 1509 TaxID=2562283 RepID=UPI0010AC912F|nr:hypothetical protein [Sinimarinibacterium sp. CAU 1509]TJY57431.1 hypothetical protein E4T66_18665 [Sinimarinibacterium sp. CAU 1509]